MTQKTINVFVHEIFSKPPKNNYSTNRPDVYYIDDLWSLKNRDLKAYGAENNRSSRYVLVVVESFSNFVWSVPL